MPPDDSLKITFEFLNDIGLPAVWHPGAHGFARHVRIAEGRLLVDPRCAASNLLHEAGHLAIVPTAYRHLISDDVEAGAAKMIDDIWSMDLDPDHPLVRAAIQCSDPEATAWAWAAGLAVGLDQEKIIQDHEYDGGGADVRLALGLSLKPRGSVSGWPGFNGLAHAGFCALHDRGPLPRYPKLAFWLQPSAAPERSVQPAMSP